MNETENISLNQDELEGFISDFGDKINGYLSDLKKKSSNEILNGSVQKAQRLLDKIVLVEEGVDKVNSAHEYLMAILDQSETQNIDSKYINEKFRGKSEKGTDKDNFGDKSMEKFRTPLLKALIYLGGSAEEDEIIEFIRKESNKLLTKQEQQKNGEEEKWISLLRKQSDCMKQEELLRFDDSRNQWEITQMGIDRLAKSDN